MLQSYHQPVECLEILFNKSKWDALPADLKAIVRNAILAESADFQHKMIDRNSRDLEELETQRKVRVFVTPRPVLEAQLKAWDVIIDRHSKGQPHLRPHHPEPAGVGPPGGLLETPHLRGQPPGLRALVPQALAGAGRGPLGPLPTARGGNPWKPGSAASPLCPTSSGWPPRG
jgi:hypothetical protein